MRFITFPSCEKVGGLILNDSEPSVFNALGCPVSTLSAKTKSKTSFWNCRTFDGGDVHEEAKKTLHDRESSDRSIVFNPFPIVFRPTPIRLMLS